MVEIISKAIKNEKGYEIIIGLGNFSIKTIDDLYTVLFQSTPDINFGVAMNDGGSSITRSEGNNQKLEELAKETCFDIKAGHVFVIYMKNAFPIHVLNAIKQIPTIINIFVASSNQIELVLAKTKQGTAVLGAIDGFNAKEKEDKNKRNERKSLLKNIGFYKE